MADSRLRSRTSTWQATEEFRVGGMFADEEEKSFDGFDGLVPSESTANNANLMEIFRRQE